MSTEGENIVLGLFDVLMSRDITPIEELSDDPAATIHAARARLESMLPNIAYIDNPQHVMASNLFFCAVLLSVFLTLSEQGADVHEYAVLMLAVLKRQSAHIPATEQPGSDLVDAAKASALSANPGEFVFDIVEGDGADFDWGMDIRSCAICGLYAQYDAMNLVPYMCASDDVVSDLSGQGLKREGTIALGATHCDFRYKKDAKGRSLHDQYPEKIHTVKI